MVKTDRTESGGGARGWSARERRWLPSSTSADIHLRDPIRQDRYVSRRLTSLPALNRMPGYSHACQFPPFARLPARLAGCLPFYVAPVPPPSISARRDLCVNVNIVAGEIRAAVLAWCTRSAQTPLPLVPAALGQLRQPGAKQHSPKKGNSIPNRKCLMICRESGEQPDTFHGLLC